MVASRRLYFVCNAFRVDGQFLDIGNVNFQKTAQLFHGLAVRALWNIGLCVVENLDGIGELKKMIPRRFIGLKRYIQCIVLVENVGRIVKLPILTNQSFDVFSDFHIARIGERWKKHFHHQSLSRLVGSCNLIVFFKEKNSKTKPKHVVEQQCK